VTYSDRESAAAQNVTFEIGDFQTRDGRDYPLDNIQVNLVINGGYPVSAASSVGTLDPASNDNTPHALVANANPGEFRIIHGDTVFLQDFISFVVRDFTTPQPVNSWPFVSSLIEGGFSAPATTLNSFSLVQASAMLGQFDSASLYGEWPYAYDADGNTYMIRFNTEVQLFTVTPEPASWLLLAVGGAVICALKARRRGRTG
jgi:hypothetical protein